MPKFGSLFLTLLVGVIPMAIAQGVDTATSSTPAPPSAQKSRVLTQQGRVFDESAAAEQRPSETGATKTRHDVSKSTIGNMKAREAAVGVSGGSVPPSGTPGTTVRETALGGPDTASRDKNKGMAKTSKPLAVGQTVPDVDVSMPKVGQPGSR